MKKRLYERTTFAGLTIAIIIILFLYNAGRISEWKIAVCSISAAIMSVSQIAFDLCKVYTAGTTSKVKDKRTICQLRVSGIILYILGIVFFITGLAIESPTIPTKAVNQITLSSFALLFLSMTIKSLEEETTDK